MFGERSLQAYSARHPVWPTSGIPTTGQVRQVNLQQLLKQTATPAAPGAAPSFGANEVAAAMQGIQALDRFIQTIPEPKTVRAKTTKDWDRVRAGLQVAKAIPFPPVQIGAMVADFFTNLVFEIFGDKPCEFQNKGPCKANVAADGSRRGGGDCCNPFKNLSGRGVIVTEHAAGYKKYPGRFAEIPAGDYWNLSGYGVPRDQMILKPPSANQIRRDMFKIAPKMFKNNDVSSMLVPQGWAVEVFTKPGFQGNHKTFGPGFHKLADMGWNDKIASMKVRGPWSIFDELYAEAFKEKRGGWITERARKAVSPDMILALNGLDPLRPKQPGYQPYESVWRPGWYLRLSEAGALNSEPVRIVFQELGFTPEDLEREKLISMEKTLDTVNLLIQTTQMPSPDQAAELLRSAFTVEQLEIAKLLSRYNLDASSLQKLKQAIVQQLASMRKKLGMSATKQTWRKPRFDITQVALQAGL